MRGEYADILSYMNLAYKDLMKKYDYLIVGTGLFGSVFNYEAKKKNKTCLVIEKRNHIGGNIYTEEVEGINIHKYGAHIFHTSDEIVWKYINQFATFNNYINAPLAIYNNEIYNLPFNMNTFNKMWGIKTPTEAKKIIQYQIDKIGIVEPKNLEEQAIKLVGKDIYNKLIKGYTEKQWGRKCSELPPFIIKRLPVRFTYNNNYFDDLYQGIPIGGYTPIIEKMLQKSEVLLNTDYFTFIKDNKNIAYKTIFTGPIDQYFNYCLGELEYRSLKFETKIINCDNYQGNAVINYTSNNETYTRIIEHKHFEFGTQPKSVITYEYPVKWERGYEPYYPINDYCNTDLYKKYRVLASKENNILFGGRLGEYKYYDMDKVIKAAMRLVEDELGEK